MNRQVSLQLLRGTSWNNKEDIIQMKRTKKLLLGLMMVTMAAQMIMPAAQAAASTVTEPDYMITSPMITEEELSLVEESDPGMDELAAAIEEVNTSIAETPAVLSSTKTGTIVASVNLRKKASTSSDVIRTVKKGETVTILDQTNSSWYKVKDQNGNTGYISSNSKYVKVNSGTTSSESSSQTGKIVSSVNLRKSATTSSSIIRKLSKGETVTILDKANSNWYKVEDSKGNVGYISSSSKYVQVSGSTSGSTSGSSGSSSSDSSVSASSTSSKIEKVIKAGYKYLGTPYEYGSDRSSTKTFDCSAFVRRIYIEGAKITLPKSSRTQATYIKKNSTVKKSISSLKRGDLVFFGKYRGSKKSDYSSVNKNTETVTHVGIYLGNNKILHTYSEKSGGVREDKMKNNAWEYRFLFGGSVL